MNARLLVVISTSMLGLGAVACTALLGDYEVGGAAVDGGGAPDVVSDSPGPDGAPEAGPRHLTNVRSLAAGARHTCALTTNGEVYCWGDNGDGQVGLPVAVARSEKPVKVPLPAGVKKIAATAFHTCALIGFDLHCWGRNACGQVGAGDMAASRQPRRVVDPASGPQQWTDVAPGLDHTCAIESGGATYCWGCNSKLQSGGAGAAPVSRPTNAGVDKQGVTGIAAGPGHTCVFGSGAPAVARCWGSEVAGALGNGDPPNDATKDAVPANVGSTVTALSAGEGHTCAVDANKAIVCWGDNGFGQVGLGAAGAIVSAPSGRIPLVQALVLSAGGAFTCFVAGADGRVRCVGTNEHGELGRAGATDTSPHPAPEAVVRPGSATEPLTATFVAAGREHACAIVTGTGEVACWGNGADGQLGDGTAGGPPRTVPVLVSGP